MAGKLKAVAVDGLVLGAIFITLQWVWTQIGNAFGLFATAANFGVLGLTVGAVLALGLGLQLADALKKRIPALR